VHGTRAAYVKDRCRCSDCTAANTAASRTADRERAYGRWQPFIDARPVHEHLVELRAAGIGVERIAGLVNMPVSHIRELATPESDGSPSIRRIRPTTAARILSVRIDNAHRAPHSHVDATGARRRLQALAAIGWSPDLLAAELGRSTSSLRRSMTSPSVTARTARDVAALYERLWNTPPPRHTAGQRAALKAIRDDAATHGWPPPLAWDDIDTDPVTQPATSTPPPDDLDEIAIERALADDGVLYDHLTPAERQAVVTLLSARGRSIRDIARQLQTTKRAVARRQQANAPAAAPDREPPSQDQTAT
jgi:hypothetical protein